MKWYLSLSDQKILFGDNELIFKIDSSNKDFLMQGLDDIGLTLKDIELISKYEKKTDNDLPWLAL